MDRRVYDHYVMKIVECGSLTKASQALGISQPALSAGLTVLEKEVGFRILNRQTKPVSFTEEGRIYYEYINRIQVVTDDYQEQINNLRIQRDQNVIVGGPDAYTCSLVADSVIRLLKRKPGYRFGLRNASVDELLEMTARRQIHCFISTREDVPSSMNKELIRWERLLVCVPEDSPVNKKLAGENGNIQPDFSVLDGEKFILLEEHQPLQQQIRMFFKLYGIHADEGITVNQSITALSFVKNGYGICIVPETTLQADPHVNHVQVWPLPKNVFGRNIYAVYDNVIAIPQACRDLIDEMKQQSL